MQHGTVPLSAGRLDVEPEANGGVSFESGTGGSYSITACIAAGAATRRQRRSRRPTACGSRSRAVASACRAFLESELERAAHHRDPARSRRASARTTNGPIGLNGT